MAGKENIKVIDLWKKLIKKVELKQKIKINLALFPPDYFKKLAQADFAIVSGGLTVFDCIARGIPVIGLPQYQHQLKTLINLKNKNVIKLGSKKMSLNKKNFINLFNRMISSFEDRDFLSKNSINLIDKKGSERVINILSSLF
jgi:spore coat polysaccharide biosynthesis predicted glycosyltransferase SpsG